MKLMRLDPAGHEKPVVRVDEIPCADMSDVTPDFDEAFFGGGTRHLEQVVAERIAAGSVHPFIGPDEVALRVGAPIACPHQILCIGPNYSDHAAESGMPVPDSAILFTKSPNTLVGANDDVIMPRGATKLDWELELGIVIGRRTSYLPSPQQVREHIAGYVVVNDVSERAFQIEPGDLINTGTPPGVGLGMTRPTYLRVGDVMTLGIDGLGEQRQTVAPPR